MPSPLYQSRAAPTGERTNRSGSGAGISLAVRPDSLSGSQTPLSGCPGHNKPRNPQRQHRRSRERAGAAGPDLTRGARGLPPLSWPAGHGDAAAGVPEMLLLRYRCPDPPRQHHFSAASASSCSSLGRPSPAAASKTGSASGAAGWAAAEAAAAPAPARARPAAPARAAAAAAGAPEPACASPEKAPASATDNARQPIAASPRAAGGDQSERKAQGFPPPLLSRLVSGSGGDAAGVWDGGRRGSGAGWGTPGSGAQGAARRPGPPRWAWGAF